MIVIASIAGNHRDLVAAGTQFGGKTGQLLRRGHHVGIEALIEKKDAHLNKNSERMIHEITQATRTGVSVFSRHFRGSLGSVASGSRVVTGFAPYAEATTE